MKLKIKTASLKGFERDLRKKKKKKKKREKRVVEEKRRRVRQKANPNV